MAEKLLNPKAAADYIEREWHLRVSAGTVRRWVAKEAVPATRDARGRILIDPADLRAIFEPASTPADNDTDACRG